MKKLILTSAMIVALAPTLAFAAHNTSITTKKSEPTPAVTSNTTASTMSKGLRRHRHHRRHHRKSSGAAAVTNASNSMVTTNPPKNAAPAKNNNGALTKLKVPRVLPLPEPEWDAETRKALEVLAGNGRAYNLNATLARHPELMRSWMVFAGHVMAKSTLPPRDREILILRTGWLCGADYELRHHIAVAKRVGITPEEIKRIEAGPDAPGWGSFDRALLGAVDELHTDASVTDQTWQHLAERYNTQQLMDLLFTVGQYHLVSMVLNSLGVQIEPGL
jgi:4-carboxymuconolactone decarboxylase